MPQPKPKSKGLHIHMGARGIQVRDPLNGGWYKLAHSQDAAMMLGSVIAPKSYGHKPQPKPDTRVLRIPEPDHACQGKGCAVCLERKELARLQAENRRLKDAYKGHASNCACQDCRSTYHFRNS